MDMQKVITMAHIEPSRTFSIRVPKSLLEDFKKACKQNESNASRTLEALMEEYVKETEEKIMEDKNVVVVNSWGKKIAENEGDWDAIVNYMDRDIAEALHSKLAPCTNQEFFDAYCKAHEKKFGETFVWDTYTLIV